MEENKNLETLGGLCNYMLSSPMPISDDVRYFRSAFPQRCGALPPGRVYAGETDTERDMSIRRL